MVEGVWATILAGGIGSRFWPASTPERPKQLLPLGSDQPLISDAVGRARAIAPDERIRVLAGRHLADRFLEVVPGLEAESCWIEPRAKGTAPVLAWAAAKIAAVDPDAVMVSMHSDHVIRPMDAFVETVTTAVEVARGERLLVCLGAVPDRPEPGYGHIELGDSLEGYAVTSNGVRAFHEKPDLETAKAYVAAGQLWNTGIFVWPVQLLLDEVAEHAPRVGEQLERVATGDDAGFFDAVPTTVIDVAVLERSERVGVVSSTFEWDDVGSWQALARTHAPDGSGNVVTGPGRIADGGDNIVFAEGGEVTLLGVSDLVVVRSGDQVLVMPREEAPRLKELLSKVEEG